MSGTKTVYHLVRLYFRIYGDESLSARNLKARLGYMLPIGLCVLVLSGLLLYALVRIAGFFVEAQLSYEFLVFFVLLVQAVQFALGISGVTKNLFGAENEDLPKLPATGMEIFVSKMIYLYLHELIFSTSLALPFFAVFAIVYRMSWVFWLMIIPVCLLFPVVPFTLTLLFSIPAMLLRKAVKNKFILLLIGAVLGISVSYTAYMFTLEYVLKLVFFGKTSINFTPELVAGITRAAVYLQPQRLLCNLLFFQDAVLSAVIILAGAVAAVSAACAIADRWYYGAFVNEIESAGALVMKKSHIARGGEFAQLANKEFVNIFRSSNYSFQYLALAVSMPVMVFFCSRMSLEVGTEGVGAPITPGLTCLVIIMFATLSSSFAASCVTREGQRIYVMKLIPQSVTLQITAKLFVYAIVGALSVSLSCAAVGAGGFLDWQAGLAIWSSCVAMAFGSICNSIKRDLKNPAFRDLGTGEMAVSNNNTVLSIAMGILASLVLGFGAISLSFYTEPVNALYFMIACAAAFCAASAGRLYFRTDRAAERIEP